MEAFLLFLIQSVGAMLLIGVMMCIVFLYGLLITRNEYWMKQAIEKFFDWRLNKKYERDQRKDRTS